MIISPWSSCGDEGDDEEDYDEDQNDGIICLPTCCMFIIFDSIAITLIGLNNKIYL